MVEIVADKFIVIVDESKLCDALGPGFPIPVEITPCVARSSPRPRRPHFSVFRSFCHEHTKRIVEALPVSALCCMGD